MSNLVRDNKVMTHKIFQGLKKWLKYTQINIPGSCTSGFWSKFCKVNSLSQIYSFMYFKHIPDDSFVVIDDTKKDRVLIGVDFNKLLTRDNFVIEESGGELIQNSTYHMATLYLTTALNVLNSKGISSLCYVDLVRELRDLFGYVVTGSNSGDVLDDLLDIVNPKTSLKTERQELLDCIARYFSRQIDSAIDNFLSRIQLFGGELSGRDNILLIANINYKKGTITIPSVGRVSTVWDILKGSKKNSYDIDSFVAILRSGAGSPRELSVVTSINNPSVYEYGTLYLIG